MAVWVFGFGELSSLGLADWLWRTERPASLFARLASTHFQYPIRFQPRRTKAAQLTATGPMLYVLQSILLSFLPQLNTRYLICRGLLVNNQRNMYLSEKKNWNKIEQNQLIITNQWSKVTTIYLFEHWPRPFCTCLFLLSFTLVEVSAAVKI